MTCSGSRGESGRTTPYREQPVLPAGGVRRRDRHPGRPHANKTTRSFEIDDTDRHQHLQLNPGTDIPLLNIVLKTILEHHEDRPEDGWIDETFVEERTDGFDDLQETLEGSTMRRQPRVWRTLEEIELAAEKYAEADNAAIFTGMGMSQHRCGSTTSKTRSTWR